MPQYRKKPIVIEATQWFRNGDHPEDKVPTRDPATLIEGEIVRRYRNPEDDGERQCEACAHLMYDHGWIDNPNCSHTVCPGDYIITDPSGHVYPCKPDIFNKTYEPVEHENAP